MSFRARSASPKSPPRSASVPAMAPGFPTAKDGPRASSRSGTVRSTRGQRNYASDMLVIDILDAQQENPGLYSHLNLGEGPGGFSWKELQELYRAKPQGVKEALALCNGRYNYVRNALDVKFANMTPAQPMQEPPAGLAGPWKLLGMLQKQKEQNDGQRSSGATSQGASSSQPPLAQGHYTLLGKTPVIKILRSRQADPTLYPEAHLGKGTEGRNRFTWADLQALHQANPKGVQDALASGHGDYNSVRQAFDTRLPFMSDAELENEPRGGLRASWRLHGLLLKQKQQQQDASRRSSRANSPR